MFTLPDCQTPPIPALAYTVLNGSYLPLASLSFLQASITLTASQPSCFILSGWTSPAHTHNRSRYLLVAQLDTYLLIWCQKHTFIDAPTAPPKHTAAQHLQCHKAHCEHETCNLASRNLVLGVNHAAKGMMVLPDVMDCQTLYKRGAQTLWGYTLYSTSSHSKQNINKHFLNSYKHTIIFVSVDHLWFTSLIFLWTAAVT